MHQRTQISTVKRQPTEWQKIFSNYIYILSLVKVYSNIYVYVCIYIVKELLQLKGKTQLKNGQRARIDFFPKKIKRYANKQ